MCVVCGNWTGRGDNGDVLQYGVADLAQQVTDLTGRIEARHRPRADWTEIDRCVRKSDDVDIYCNRLKEVFNVHSAMEEPADQRNDSLYEQQQLRNAFMKGCFPQISSFIIKQMVTAHC